MVYDSFIGFGRLFTIFISCVPSAKVIFLSLFGVFVFKYICLFMLICSCLYNILNNTNIMSYSCRDRRSNVVDAQLRERDPL